MHRIWLPGALLVMFLGASVGPAPAQPSPFNRVTSIVVSEDWREAQLFGVLDPAGPSISIPYQELLLEALRLARENSAVGELGFSLEPAADNVKSWASFKHKMATFEDDVAAYLARDAQAYQRYMATAVAQAIAEVRTSIKSYLLELGKDRRRVSLILDRVRNPDDLSLALAEIDRVGLLSKDDPYLSTVIDTAIDRYKNGKGNIFIYPIGITEQVSQIRLTYKPVFYGVDDRSQLARILFESDITLKMLSTEPSLKEGLPFHQPLVEWRLRRLHRSGPQLAEPLTAITIRPISIKLAVSSDSRVLYFANEEVGVALGSREPGRQLDDAHGSYAQFMTAHFNKYAAVMPPLWELREAYKIVAAARYLGTRGLSLDMAKVALWSPPEEAVSIAISASIGMGDDRIGRVSIVGGVSLRTEQQTTVNAAPAKAVEAARRVVTSAQLDSVVKSRGSGVCYDGQPGCLPGTPLGKLVLKSPPRGSASLAPEIVKRLKLMPSYAPLLEEETRASATWATAREKTMAAQKELDRQPTRGDLQVSLSAARQAESTAKSVLDTVQVKIEDAGRVIVTLR